MDKQEQKQAQIEILDYIMQNLCSCETCTKGKIYIQKERNFLRAELRKLQKDKTK